MSPINSSSNDQLFVSRKPALSLGTKLSAQVGVSTKARPRAQGADSVSAVGKNSTSTPEGINWHVPVKNPVIRGYSFGNWNPQSNKFGKGVRIRKDGSKRDHQGVDILAPIGTPIYAVQSGIIAKVDVVEGFGNYVTLQISVAGKKLYAFYGHLSQVSVKEGRTVKAGDVLGKTGISGIKDKLPPSEHHLHFGISTESVPIAGMKTWKDPKDYIGIRVQDKITKPDTPASR